jgi:hypothetical protein
VLSLRGTRRFCRLFDPLLPALLSPPLGRKLLMWQNIARPERVPPGVAVEIARAFGRSPGFDEHLDATIPQRFVGGSSIAVPVSVAFGGRTDCSFGTSRATETSCRRRRAGSSCPAADTYRPTTIPTWLPR